VSVIEDNIEVGNMLFVSHGCGLFAAKSRALEKKLVQVITEDEEVMMEN